MEAGESISSRFLGSRKDGIGSARFFAVFASILARFARSGRNAPRAGQQLPPGKHQIREAKQAEQLRRVLGQPLVANLAMTKQIFDDMERMFRPAPESEPWSSPPQSASP